MTVGDHDTARRVTATANRLRMVQVDFAEYPADVRKEYLVEEVDRALAVIVPEERKAFLQQLQEKFPTWDQLDLDPQALQHSTRRSAFDEKELTDCSFLVAKLVELAPTLAEPARAAIVGRLGAAGLGGAPASGVDPQMSAAIRAKLQLGATEPIDPARMADLLDMLIEFAAGLDLLAWNTWKTLAPSSSVRRTTPLQRMMGRFAVSDPEVPRSVMAVEVGRLRRLIAAIISAIGQVGRKFAEDYVIRFSPAQIEDLVKAQGGGTLFGNVKVKYWDQYVQMSAQQDANGVEHEIMSAVAEYAETLIKGLGR